MRAAITTCVPTDRAVSVTDWPDPAVPPGWAMVRLRAAALNRLDRMTMDDRRSLPGPSIGASTVVRRDRPDFVDALVEATGGRADLALDPTGALWQPLLQSLRPGGRLVAVGKMASESATAAVQTVYWKQVDILGSSMGSPHDFAAFLAHVNDANWSPLIDYRLPLEEIHAAYARLDSQARVGKVVLDLAGE